MTDHVTIGGFTISLTTTVPAPARHAASIDCGTCGPLPFTTTTSHAEAVFLADQHNRLAHGGGRRAEASALLDPAEIAFRQDITSERELLARAAGGVCIAVDDETSTECGDWTEENSRYCPAHTEEADDAGEEYLLTDWETDLTTRETDRAAGKRITTPPPTPGEFPDWLAESVITSLETDHTQLITGTTRRGKTSTAHFLELAKEDMDAGRCGCCDMRHGRPLNPGEHCSWCRRGLTHRLTWAVRGSLGR